MPIPSMLPELAPPALLPLSVAKTESSSSFKSRKRNGAGAHVPFLSSAAEGAHEHSPQFFGGPSSPIPNLQ
jgi:hypothetical protein